MIVGIILQLVIFNNKQDTLSFTGCQAKMLVYGLKDLLDEGLQKV